MVKYGRQSMAGHTTLLTRWIISDLIHKSLVISPLFFSFFCGWLNSLVNTFPPVILFIFSLRLSALLIHSIYFTLLLFWCLFCSPSLPQWLLEKWGGIFFSKERICCSCFGEVSENNSTLPDTVMLSYMLFWNPLLVLLLLLLTLSSRMLSLFSFYLYCISFHYFRKPMNDRKWCYFINYYF